MRIIQNTNSCQNIFFFFFFFRVFQKIMNTRGIFPLKAQHCQLFLSNLRFLLVFLISSFLFMEDIYLSLPLFKLFTMHPKLFLQYLELTKKNDIMYIYSGLIILNRSQFIFFINKYQEKKAMNHCYSQGTFGAGQRKQNNYPNSYINVRIDNAKDISTIFHSPYKNGKKNNSFRNPSFLSSDLFYPEQCQKVCTHKNVVQNRNQKVYRKMHEERVKNYDHHLKKMYDQSCSARKSEKCLQSRNRASRSQIRKDRTTQLASQLKSLIHYGQKQVTQKKDQRKEEIPIYSVKYRQEIENQQQCRQRRDLEQWMNISQKMKNNKHSIQRQNKKKQTVIMDETIRHNKENVACKAEKSRVNAEILSNILREQIKQKQRREKSRMKF